MACRRQANAVSHSLMRALSAASAPAFLAGFGHDRLRVADILRCGPHLAPRISASLHCSLESGWRQLVHINHALTVYFHTFLRPACFS